MAIVTVYNRDGTKYGTLDTGQYVFNNNLIGFEPITLDTKIYPYVKVNGYYYVNDGGEFFSKDRVDNSAGLTNNKDTFQYKGSSYLQNVGGLMSMQSKDLKNEANIIDTTYSSQYASPHPWRSYYVPNYGINGAALNGYGLTDTIIGEESDDIFLHSGGLAFDCGVINKPVVFNFCGPFKPTWIYDDFNYEYAEYSQCRNGYETLVMTHDESNKTLTIGDTVYNFDWTKDQLILFYREPTRDPLSVPQVSFSFTGVCPRYASDRSVNFNLSTDGLYNFELNDIQIKYVDFSEPVQSIVCKSTKIEVEHKGYISHQDYSDLPDTLSYWPYPNSFFQYLIKSESDSETSETIEWEESVISKKVLAHTAKATYNATSLKLGVHLSNIQVLDGSSFTAVQLNYDCTRHSLNMDYWLGPLNAWVTAEGDYRGIISRKTYRNGLFHNGYHNSTHSVKNPIGYASWSNSDLTSWEDEYYNHKFMTGEGYQNSDTSVFSIGIKGRSGFYIDYGLYSGIYSSPYDAPHAIAWLLLQKQDD